jgi:hypothetical protein
MYNKMLFFVQTAEGCQCCWYCCSPHEVRFHVCLFCAPAAEGLDLIGYVEVRAAATATAAAVAAAAAAAPAAAALKHTTSVQAVLYTIS